MTRWKIEVGLPGSQPNIAKGEKSPDNSALLNRGDGEHSVDLAHIDDADDAAAQGGAADACACLGAFLAYKDIDGRPAIAARQR